MLVPADEAQLLASSRSIQTFPKGVYCSVTSDDYETVHGPNKPFTVDLPILYAVQPCDKPFPEDMDYEIT